MALERKLRTLIAGVISAAVVVTVAVFDFFPPPYSHRAVLAFGTLLLLSILSGMLYLKFTESGSTTSMDFVPQLGAILLLGPAGAVAVTLASELISQLFLYREKALFKKVFNAAQLILAVAAAGVVYVAFTGTPSLIDLQFRPTLPPFILAVLVYFAVNTGTVSYVVSLSEGRPYLECWREITAGLIVFDVAMSPLAYVVAYLYVKFNPLALLLAIIPLIGLRYSYGINFELRQLNTDLLRLMVKTIEAQDPYTSGHSIRVAEAARTIARAIKVRPKDAEIIETAALLHDLGKIDVAYNEILRQKGPLTAEQRELIRAHPDRGVDIIKSIRSIHPEVLKCVRHHHERWDGDGYPAGLGGEEIPLGARIIGVCDTIDAMTTARPYRSALPVEVVREELEKHSGTQFDPTVVTAVLAAAVLEKLESPQLRVQSGGERLAGVAPVKGHD